jgi:hypothetical protein
VIEHSHYRVSLMLGKRLAGYVTSGATAAAQWPA